MCLTAAAQYCFLISALAVGVFCNLLHIIGTKLISTTEAYCKAASVLTNEPQASHWHLPLTQGNQHANCRTHDEFIFFSALNTYRNSSSIAGSMLYTSLTGPSQLTHVHHSGIDSPTNSGDNIHTRWTEIPITNAICMAESRCQ